MNLEETIIHFENKYAQELENAKAVEEVHGKLVKGYLKHSQAASEYKQLADWLKELQTYRNENLKNSENSTIINIQS